MMKAAFPMAHPFPTDTPKAILAPMAGVTDIAFREMCLDHGADLTYSEMVSAKGLSYGSTKTRDLLTLSPQESTIAVQIFGHEPDTMARQAAWIEEALGAALAIVDINMGCPARKIVTKGDGAALMKDPETAARIVCAVSAAIEAPVSVKFRRGWHQGEDTSLEFARRMEDAGADVVTVHGRYAMQYYKGAADWECIARVKEALAIPVVGNGDIASGADAVAMIERTGCDHVMIARAAVGNPWIFDQVHAALNGTQPHLPTVSDRVDAMRTHARKLDEANPRLLVRMRKHASAYIKGLPGAAAARCALNRCVTLDDYLRTFDEFEKRACERVAG